MAVGLLSFAASPSIPPATGIAAKVLLVYNSSSTDGLAVANYYTATRPGMAGIDVLALTADTTEKTTQANLASQIRTPIYNWLAANPTKPKMYIIMCRGFPSRVWDATLSVSPYASVDYLLARSDPNLSNSVGTEYSGTATFPGTAYVTADNPGTSFLVTRLDMGGSLAATKAYIDKIATMYAAMSSPNVVVSALGASLAGTEYIHDDSRDAAYTSVNNISSEKTNLPTFAPGTTGHITYNSASFPNGNVAPLASASNVSGYFAWGVHNFTPWSNNFPSANLTLSGNSNWYLVKTLESYNGIIGFGMSTFVDWWNPATGGGTSYSRTPVGMACNTDEPTTSGVNGLNYFVHWDLGLLLSECGWGSRRTQYFMMMGDPLVTR